MFIFKQFDAVIQKKDANFPKKIIKIVVAGQCKQFIRLISKKIKLPISSTTKSALAYLGAFRGNVDAITYFTAYFAFYNKVRLHAKIGYVTPV